MSARTPAAVALVAVALALGGCLHTIRTGNLVPPTVDRDSSAPSVEIDVAGHSRAVHLETFGSPQNPVLLVLHGSLADYRAFLPYRVLSDRYFVVMWDQRGSGLSERITAAEFSFDSVVEEIGAIKAIYAPDRPVTLLGHSFGAMYAVLYMSRHPEDVTRAVLIEPAALNGAIMQATFKDLFEVNMFDFGLNASFWQSELLSPSDHEAMDYKAMQMLLNTRLTRYHCDPDNAIRLPVWRPGAHIELIRSQRLQTNGRFDYDFAAGLTGFPREVLIVASECSAIGYDFQVRYHKPLFRKAEIARVEGAGHRLFVERGDEVLRLVSAYLDR